MGARSGFSSGGMLLTLLPETLAVARFDAATRLPPEPEGLWSITCTADEISVVCPADAVPIGAQQVESGWRALKVAGPLDFSLTGILAQLAVALAEARIAIFALSTFDTDYVLVRDLEGATRALWDAGHVIEE